MFDNSSPTKLRIYAVIYGIKNDTLHNLGQSIYHWEKAYEISWDEKFDLNGNDILKTPHLHQLLPIYQIKHLL